MTASLVALIIGFFAKGGSKLAAAVVPYLVYLTPVLVVIEAGIVFYLRNRADTFDLILVALLTINLAIVCEQIDSFFLKPPSLKS